MIDLKLKHLSDPKVTTDLQDATLKWLTREIERIEECLEGKTNVNSNRYEIHFRRS